jgi:hypothetical protein
MVAPHKGRKRKRNPNAKALAHTRSKSQANGELDLAALWDTPTTPKLEALCDLYNRVRSNEPLTNTDRQYLANLLWDLIINKNASPEIPARGRGRPSDKSRDLAVAFHVEVLRRKEKPAANAKNIGQVAEAWGLKDKNVTNIHAKHKKEAAELIDSHADNLEILVKRLQMERLLRLKNISISRA